MPRRASRSLITAAALLWLAAGRLPAQPPIQDFAGVISVLKFTPANWTQTAYDTAAQGLDWFRLAIFWNYLGDATNPYNYNANHTDVYYTSIPAWQRGIRVFGILNVPNDAANHGWTPANINPNVYQTYLKVAEDMAYYYGFAIEAWEAGNEVNGTDAFWNGVYHSGASYATLLRDLHAALLRGFQRRGDYAQLVAARGGEGFKLYAAGTAGSDLIWLGEVCAGLEQVYQQHGDGPYISGFSIHPYSFPNGPDVTTVYSQGGYPQHPISHGTLLQNLDWTRATLRGHPSVPQELYISEYGWSTLTGDPQGVTQDQQAVYIAQSLIEAHGSKNLSRTLLGGLSDNPPFPVYSIWGYLGLLNQDLTKKPSFRALEAAVHKLSGQTLKQDLGWLFDNGHAYLYGGAGRQVLALWNPTQRTVAVKLSAGTHAKLFNHFEDQLQDYPAGQTTVNPLAAAAPRYLEVTGGTITEIDGIKLKADGTLNLAGYSQVPTTWSRASSTVAGFPSTSAFDGDVNTYWNAGAFAPAWIEVKMYNTQRVRALLLQPGMLPSGVVDHRIDLSINYGPYQEVKGLKAYVVDGMKLLVVLPQAYDTVSHVRVRTVPVSGPVPAAHTWVAWKEIQIFQ